MKERQSREAKESINKWTSPTEDEIERLKSLRDVWANNPRLTRNQVESKLSK